MTYKNKKHLSILLKVVILVLAAVFIYHKISDNTNLRNFKTLTHSLDLTKVCITLSLVFLLMFFNWLLEALKWRFLVREIERISVWRSIESVFCGLTLAVFTPNRIGEYGGRVFFLSPKRRILGIIAMAVGSVGQMVVTNVFGALAVLWFLKRFVAMDDSLYTALFVGGLGFCAFFILLYFKIRWLLDLLTNISFLKRFKKFFEILGRYKASTLFRVFLYCIARFVVFTSQYCLLIGMLIPQIPVFQMAMMVCILFFIQSALPSLDLLDVGVRTLTASFFFSYITHQEVAIIAATAFIWLVNLIIPAILGVAFVFKLNFFGTNNN